MGGSAKAWCLRIHSEASLSLSEVDEWNLLLANPHVPLTPARPPDTPARPRDQRAPVIPRPSQPLHGADEILDLEKNPHGRPRARQAGGYHCRPARLPHPPEHSQIRWVQPRQNLRREDLGQLPVQPPEQRRRIGYQPRRLQPAQQLVLVKLGALGLAQQRGERARQAHDVSIIISLHGDGRWGLAWCGGRVWRCWGLPVGG